MSAPLIDPLVAQILEQNSRNLAFTTNALIDNLTARLDEERAELAAVRDEIQRLLAGSWMPTSDALIRALYPAGSTINSYKEVTTS